MRIDEEKTKIKDLFSGLMHKVLNLSFIKKITTGNRWLVKFYFELKYLRGNPYRVEANPLEIEKFNHAFDIMKEKRYDNILEIGCGDGYLLERYSPLSDRVLATDISGSALKMAKERLRGEKHIEFRQFDLIKDDIDEKFDLVICSEILYYFTLDQLKTVVPKILNYLKKNGNLLSIHIRSLNDDTLGFPYKAFGAKTIHNLFEASGGLRTLKREILENYEIVLYQNTGQ